MSRRDGRDSDSRRHHSRFDQGPSPKRSRRDGKPETERTLDVALDNKDHLTGDQKHRRRLQDALPLEAPDKEASKVGVVTKESDKVQNERDGTKYSSNPTEVPRSRSYFQHDERGYSGQDGRRFNHRTTAKDGGRRDPKEQQMGGGKRTSPSNTREKDERARTHARDNDTWRHDKYLDMEADPRPPARKRPFREQKITEDPEKADKSVVEPVKTNASEHPVLENEKRDERGGYNARHLDRSERPAVNREANIGEAQRSNFPPRGRFGIRGGYNREQDRFNPRQGYRLPGNRVEKWKHDLFDETNRSPSPKNEEDAIAKVEALLAS